MDKVSYTLAYSLASRLFSKGFAFIERGRNNWVFKSSDRILTIPRHERVKSYAVRVKATEFLASQGIPVAEVLDYSSSRNGEPEYLLVKKVKGSNIDLSKSSLNERERIHQSAGEILKAMHQLAGCRYGRFNQELIGEHTSWVNFTDNFFKDSIDRVMLSSSLSKRYEQILKKEYMGGRKRILNFSNPSFLHADFHLGNLLFHNSKVSAILDLDIVTSGDPNWDTGHYCHTFNIDRENGIKAFRRGYSNSCNIDRERLYCLMIWAKKIGSQAVQRPEALKETIPELEKILKGVI